MDIQSDGGMDIHETANFRPAIATDMHAPATDEVEPSTADAGRDATYVGSGRSLVPGQIVRRPPPPPGTFYCRASFSSGGGGGRRTLWSGSSYGIPTPPPPPPIQGKRHGVPNSPGDPKRAHVTRLLCRTLCRHEKISGDIHRPTKAKE